MSEIKEKAIHELKIQPEYYEAVEKGVKTFEIRKNDRNFKVGDRILLREFDDSGYTDREISKTITYITDYAQKDNYVVMGLI